MIRYVTASKTLAPANQTLYTAPLDVASAIVIFGVCNNTDVSDTMTVHVVASGGAATDSNQYITAKAVNTANPDPLDPITGMVLNPGDFIVALSGANSTLNMRISVMEIVDV